MTAATLAEKLRIWGITFGGTTDPITFIQHLEERAKAYEVNVETMPQAIPGLLTDTAEHWFVSRRGIPEKVWCDNATNFVGADRHMREFRARLEEQGGGIATFASRRGCEFAFIPPRAPHFGGLWEAGVKSAKHLFLRTVGEDILTAEELGTLLASVEAVLNSRPLGAISTDPNGGEALSPCHLLIGGPLLAPPSAALPDQVLAAMALEYVSSLQAKNKWHQEVPNVAVGALVVVAEDNLPPQQWMIGRIVAVHVGKVRVADVKTKDTTYRRAVHRLAVLPVAC
ncbi:uncharacterized protein [Drosophila takahashii]|uniref:uncharacterized protein n=1 Tax=Drosophila takahashii TaxID=29030 RepID=UPI0038995F7A